MADIGNVRPEMWKNMSKSWITRSDKSQDPTLSSDRSYEFDGYDGHFCCLILSSDASDDENTYIDYQILQCIER